MNEQLRRAVNEALNRTGMLAGLPKCTVDASQLKHLLDKYDAAEDEIQKLKRERQHLRNVIDIAAEQQEAADAKLTEWKNTLHCISLASQNSMSSKEECGRLARAALTAAEPRCRYECHFCRREIAERIVEFCRKGGVPVCCPCRHGSLGSGATVVRRIPRPAAPQSPSP